MTSSSSPFPSSRRGFLRSSALILGGSVLPATTSAGRQPKSRSETVADDYWEMVRRQFRFTEAAVPMNAANLCPSFRAVAEEVDRLTADIDTDCSFENRAKFAELTEATRSLVARQLGIEGDEIALVRNTSEANNIVNNGLQLEPGDEVVLWDENHPTNNVAWEVRAARFGLQVRKVHTPATPEDPEQLVDAFVSALGPRTRVLALTHLSNLSGVLLPIAELVAAAHARGIYVHVDGAQAWGALALDLRALGVDSFSASAHKWFMGPKEVGLLYVAQRNIGRIWPSIVAPGWGDDLDADPVGARKFESMGQRDDAALAALGLAAALHDEIGPARVEARIRHLAQTLKAGIVDLGLEVSTPMSPALSHGVCITAVPEGRARELSSRLYQEHGIAGAPTGGLRLCPTIYNTEAHIERAIAGVKALLA